MVLGHERCGGANAVLGDDHAGLAWIVVQVADPLGQLFLRLMLLLVVPLVASSLIVAVAGLGDLRKVGRIGLHSFILASEERLGVPKPVGTFVLTIGATANQNGTALFEGVTVLFLAQLAGVDLSLSQQVMVVYLAILGGIGTADVPSGSIPFVIAVLASVGVDPALIAVVLGVDRLLDMCRTVVNVTGDLTMSAIVARAQGWRPEPGLALGSPSGGADNGSRARK